MSKSIDLYPNPAIEEIRFKGLTQKDEIEVFILDITGRLMIKEELNSSKNAIQLDNFPQGTYIASFKLGTNTVRKIFIEKE